MLKVSLLQYFLIAHSALRTVKRLIRAEKWLIFKPNKPYAHCGRAQPAINKVAKMPVGRAPP